jgi:hypothetical protein
MEHQVTELTPETCKAICNWMERALLRLGVLPTYVTYHAKYVPTVTGRLVLCTMLSFLTRTFQGSRGTSATTPI